MYQRMKCPTCKENLFSPTEECREPNHTPAPDTMWKKDAPLFVWNFRLGRMVDIETHRLIENMAGGR